MECEKRKKGEVKHEGKGITGGVGGVITLDEEDHR